MVYRNTGPCEGCPVQYVTEPGAFVSLFKTGFSVVASKKPVFDFGYFFWSSHHCVRFGMLFAVQATILKKAEMAFM